MYHSIIDFNSIKVRLEHAFILDNYKGDDNFNSIKVRLERLSIFNPIAKFLLFQFHKGAIRTAAENNAFVRCYYFNSIKVRLELSPTSKRLPTAIISIP